MDTGVRGLSLSRCGADSGLSPCCGVHRGDRPGLFGEASQVADEWQREQRHRLKHEGAGAVLEDIRVLVQGRETGLSKPLAYMEKREAQMRYPVWQAHGWPIGSGAVEMATSWWWKRG